MKRTIALLILGAFGATILAGCGPKDVDPHEKVDAAGYYNGPMEKHGKGGGTADASTK